MKNKSFITLLSVSLLAFSSCSDFFDTLPIAARKSTVPTKYLHCWFRHTQLSSAVDWRVVIG